MKLVLFSFLLVFAYPVGRWLRERPKLRLALWTLIGFLPFYAAPDRSLYFFGDHLGDVHGFEIGDIDCLVLCLWYAYRGNSRPLPYRVPLAIYVLVALGSALQAQWVVLSLGYAWRLGRMYLLFLVIWRAADDRGMPVAILRGLTFGVVYELPLVVWQHYGLGIFQASGSFAHQNTLGVLVNLVVMIPLALIFAGPTSLVTKLAPIAAVAAAFFTVSRGTLMFLGIGAALVFLGSTLKRYKVRKAWIGVSGLVVILAVIPVAVATIETRGAEQLERSMDQRVKLEAAARLMLKEHPFGVGPNSFMTELLFDGYADRAGLPWSQQVALVHNVYWLTAAEMGYPGIVALLILFLAPLGTAFRYGLRTRHDRRSDVLLAIGVGLTMFYVHHFFEWLWRQTEVSYVYFAFIALIAVLKRQIDQDDLVERQTIRRAQTVPVTATPVGAGSSVAALNSSSSLRASRRTS